MKSTPRQGIVTRRDGIRFPSLVETVEEADRWLLVCGRRISILGRYQQPSQLSVSPCATLDSLSTAMNWRCALGFHELRAWNWPTYSNEPVPYGPRNAPTWYSWRECARCGTYWLRDQYDGLAPPEWKRATAVEYFDHIDSLREAQRERRCAGR